MNPLPPDSDLVVENDYFIYKYNPLQDRLTLSSIEYLTRGKTCENLSKQEIIKAAYHLGVKLPTDYRQHVDFSPQRESESANDYYYRMERSEDYYYKFFENRNYPKAIICRLIIERMFYLARANQYKKIIKLLPTLRVLVNQISTINPESLSNGVLFEIFQQLLENAYSVNLINFLIDYLQQRRREATKEEFVNLLAINDH